MGRPFMKGGVDETTGALEEFVAGYYFSLGMHPSW